MVGPRQKQTSSDREIGRFENEPFADFTREPVRRAFTDAVAQVRARLGRKYPLIIGGREVYTDDILPSVNPADPKELIGDVCQAFTREIDLAIEAAQKAAPGWKARRLRLLSGASLSGVR